MPEELQQTAAIEDAPDVYKDELEDAAIEEAVEAIEEESDFMCVNPALQLESSS